MKLKAKRRKLGCLFIDIRKYNCPDEIEPTPLDLIPKLQTSKNFIRLKDFQKTKVLVNTFMKYYTADQ